MSFSMNKLKAFIPRPDSLKLSSSTTTTTTTSSNKRSLSSSSSNPLSTFNEKLEPEVGFKLTLDGSMYDDSSTTSSSKSHKASQKNNSTPELLVNLIGVRHLPTSFGLKSVEGYMIKVKLFPGSQRYESTIQTSSWASFNETFKFPLTTAAAQKSSIKSKSKESNHVYQNEVAGSLPEKLFKGNFIVFTVFALLELPPGTGSSIKEKYNSFKRKGSLMLKDKPIIGKLAEGTLEKVEAKEKEDESTKRLTRSESQRNIGSVNCFLDPKMFTDIRNSVYSTEELWMPIKDMAISPIGGSTKANITTSLRGQVEMILQLSDYNQLTPTDDSDKKSNKNSDHQASSSSSNSSGSFLNIKKLLKNKNDKSTGKKLLLSVTTSKMRCPIKVKEEFENQAEKIYIKTTIFQHDILSNSWKSEQFTPTLSIKFDADKSTMSIPISCESDLNYVSIKVTLGTKTKVGKKIVLGTLNISADSSSAKLQQWQKMRDSRCTPITMWQNLE
uniref:C2 domain-containing protein n=1 Tax=Corethrella appendiculata TaxID=1370023 RepID=U5EPC7_9DIPT